MKRFFPRCTGLEGDLKKLFAAYVEAASHDGPSLAAGFASRGSDRPCVYGDLKLLDLACEALQHEPMVDDVYCLLNAGVWVRPSVSAEDGRKCWVRVPHVRLEV